MSSKEMLEKICEGECSSNYCILKEIILNSQCDRLLMQFKIMEIHKYLLSEREKREYTWQESIEHYVKIGYAESFAKNYSDKMSPIEIYKKIELEVRGK